MRFHAEKEPKARKFYRETGRIRAIHYNIRKKMPDGHPRGSPASAVKWAGFASCYNRFPESKDDANITKTVQK
jgi:hypothetical protein